MVISRKFIYPMAHSMEISLGYEISALHRAEILNCNLEFCGKKMAKIQDRHGEGRRF
jgi:hypothetical protein